MTKDEMLFALSQDERVLKKIHELVKDLDNEFVDFVNSFNAGIKGYKKARKNLHDLTRESRNLKDKMSAIHAKQLRQLHEIFRESGRLTTGTAKGSTNNRLAISVVFNGKCTKVPVKLVKKMLACYGWKVIGHGSHSIPEKKADGTVCWKVDFSWGNFAMPAAKDIDKVWNRASGKKSTVVDTLRDLGF